MVVHQMIKKLPALWLITVFTRACHWALSWAG